MRAQNLPGVLSVKYQAGELVFPEGGFAAGVYLVAQGLVGLFRTRGYQNVCLFVAGPEDLFGLEAWLNQGRPQYRAAARALTDVNLLFLPLPVWEKAVEDEEFRKLVFSHLAQMWLDALERGAHKADAQAAILWAFQRWGQEIPEEVQLPLNTSVLAVALGLSRTAVKQAVARLGIAQREDRLVLERDRLHLLFPIRSPQ